MEEKMKEIDDRIAKLNLADRTTDELGQTTTHIGDPNKLMDEVQTYIDTLKNKQNYLKSKNFILLKFMNKSIWFVSNYFIINQLDVKSLQHIIHNTN